MRNGRISGEGARLNFFVSPIKGESKRDTGYGTSMVISQVENRSITMSQSEIKEIMEEEKLTHINWFREQDLKENQVGIAKENDIWIIYVTDERANIVDGSMVRLDNEEEAYDLLLKKARYAKRKFAV